MEKRPPAINDLARIRTAYDPQISPDGTRIVFVVKTMDTVKNRYFTHLWMVSTSDTDAAPSVAPRQWTFGIGSEKHPRWSPDGRWVAFISGREEKKEQIYVISSEGGESERLTDLPHGSIQDLKWSPNSQEILFSFRPQDDSATEKAVEERKKDHKSTPMREITRLHYRQEGTGFLPAARYQLHILQMSDHTFRQITESERDVESFCWSPDGARIAYTQNVADDPDLLPNHTALFVMTPGEGEPSQINAPFGAKENLAWSPNGSHIAYLGHDKPEEVWGITNTHLWVAPLDGSPARDLTAGWDVHLGSAAIGDVTGGGDEGPVWAGDSGAVLVLASESGAVNLYQIALADGTRTKHADGMHAVLGFSVSSSGEQIALLRATSTDAGDIYLLTPEGNLNCRTELNSALFSELNLSVPHYFEAPSEGHTVPCWAVLPAEDKSAAPHPTLLYIHGGPHAMYAHILFWEYQVLAAQGYAVLFPNPRGSKGYGEAWTGAVKNNWGEPAQADCLACVDYAIDQKWADTERLGVIGGSYGGYLTGWIVGHSDRFRAALAERGVFNLLSMAGTCDFIWRDHDYFHANTGSDPAEYLRNSPLTYTDKITTPLLILHSEGDLRCPIEQAEQFFAALKRQRKEVVFLRYPVESNHELSRGGVPDLRLDRQQRIITWFDQYLKQPKAVS